MSYDRTNLHHDLRLALAGIFQEIAQNLREPSDRNATFRTAGPAIFEAAVADGFLSTEWPRLSVDVEQAFRGLEEGSFLERFQPGRDAYLYVAGSSGLSRLAKSPQLPLFKLGISAQPDLLTRQSELRVDRYAAFVKEGREHVASEGFDDWEIRQCELGDLRPNPVISALPRALKIRMPKNLTLKDFERELHKMLTPISLDAWSASPDAAAHFAALGLKPMLARRYTAYRFGSATRYSAAREIYICRPRNDLGKVAAVVARIIRGHVLAERSTP